MEFKTAFPLDELVTMISEELKPFLKEKEPDIEFPLAQKSRQLSKGDFAIMLGSVCGRLKKNPVEYTKQLAQELQEYLDSRVDREKCLVTRCVNEGPYLNIFINRVETFRMGLQHIMKMGSEYGKSNVMKGKKVLVEHTSSNPNAPLHIGNLRNVLLGAHLSKLLKAVGCEVSEHFLVNDLGAQIGLTVLGYSKVYALVQPRLKIDQWVGIIYAIMNTFSELQQLGVDLVTFNGKSELPARSEESQKKLDEYISIYNELGEREPELFTALLNECKLIPDIKKTAGELNLAYEQNKPDAVRVFRKMVTDTLSGVQKTLDTFGVKHDQWDFESELGWSGSNDRVMATMIASPYYIPPTQSNAEGVPQGGHLDLDTFIHDAGLPVGKKGYQKNYPPLYIVRPDGSTLYSFRDVVYSLQKEGGADMVLNVICVEQNLAQEKVALALKLVHPERPRKLFHVGYEYVKLTEGKMSGRRGRYLLADDLYGQLRDVIKTVISERSTDKDFSQEELDHIIHEVSAASMKYSLLASSGKNTINFSVAKCTSFEDASAPFLLYNSSRLNTLQLKFEGDVAKGEYPTLPSQDEIDYTKLDDQAEWELLLEYIFAFPTMVKLAACPPVPNEPALPEWGTHKVCDFLIAFVRSFSSYYKRVRILQANDVSATHTRLYLTKVLKTVLDNGMRLLLIEPLPRM